MLGLWLWRAATAQEVVPPFEKAECPFPVPIGYRIDCGFVSVPEDRSQPDSPLIKIGVALVHSRADQPAPDPIFFLNGGPGGALIAALPNMLAGFEPMLSVRDLVFFDQRGAGWSQPSLVCPEIEALKIAESERTALAAGRESGAVSGLSRSLAGRGRECGGVQHHRECGGRGRSSSRAGLRADQSVWSIVRHDAGASDCARLPGLYSQRGAGLGVPDLGIRHGRCARQSDAYLDTIFANCEKDLVCRTVYPDLPTVFAQLTDRVRQHPIVFANSDPATQEAFTTTIDHVGLIGWLVYTDPRQVPGLIYDLRDGDVTAIVKAQQAMLKDVYRPQWPLSEGMKVSVLCSCA